MGAPRDRRRSGTEPATARSPLRLRAALAAFGLVASLALAGWLLADGRGRPTGTALVVLLALAVAAALAAVLDLYVLSRRLRHRPDHRR